MKDDEQVLRHLPPPSEEHEAAVTQCICELYKRVTAREADIELYRRAYLQLQKIVKEISPSNF
jgi:hypothetical protein